MRLKVFLAATLAMTGVALAADYDEIGSVTTNFRMTGSDKIVVEGFDDPRVPGVGCHLSRAVTGGVASWVGMAEDKSDASIACRQVGPIKVSLSELKKYDNEDAFSKSTNIFFKTMHVRRMVDVKRNTIIYLVYSDKLINGSPKNAISSVPVMPWPGQ